MRQITAQQAREWELFTVLEPFPEDRITHSVAILGQLVSVGMRVKSRGRNIKVSELIPKYELKMISNAQAEMEKIKRIFMGLVERAGKSKEGGR